MLGCPQMYFLALILTYKVFVVILCPMAHYFWSLIMTGPKKCVLISNKAVFCSFYIILEILLLDRFFFGILQRLHEFVYCKWLGLLWVKLSIYFIKPLYVTPSTETGSDVIIPKLWFAFFSLHLLNWLLQFSSQKMRLLSFFWNEN